MTAAFAVPGFRRLFAAAVVSGLGDAVLLLVLSMWVKSLTGSNGLAGATFAFMLLPTLAAPLLGLLIDRMPRRRVVVWGNLLSALAVLPLLLVRDAGDVWIIWAVSFVYGVSFIVLPAASNALLKELLTEDLLAGANGAIQTTREAIRLFGPLVGAWLFARVGGGAVAVVDAVSFLAAAGVLATLAAGTTTPTRDDAPSRREELLGGLHWIASDRALRHTTVGFALTLLVVGASESTIYAILDAFGRPVTDAATVVTVQGVGAVLGAVLAGRLVGAFGEVAVVGAGLLALAVGVAVVAVAPTLAVVLVAAALIGVTLPPVFIAFTTMQQRRTPSGLMGRVSAATELLLGVPQAISVAGGSVLVAILPYRTIWLGMALVISCSGAYVLASLADLVRARAVPAVDEPRPATEPDALPEPVT